MLLQHNSTLLELSATDQLAHFPMDRNQSAGIVMTAVHQHHADTEFAEHFFIERIQPLVAVEADQQTVKMKIVTDGAGPIPVAHGQFVLLYCAADFLQQIWVRSVRRKHGGDLPRSM